MSSAEVLLEQSDLGPHCFSKGFLKHFFKRQNQTTFAVIAALRIRFAIVPYVFIAHRKLDKHMLFWYLSQCRATKAHYTAPALALESLRCPQTQRLVQMKSQVNSFTHSTAGYASKGVEKEAFAYLR